MVAPVAPTGKDDTDQLIAQLVAQDTTPWYRKPNLRLLYLLFFPTCIGVEMTSGYVFCWSCYYSDMLDL